MSRNAGMSLKTMVTISKTSQVSTAFAPALILSETDFGIIWESSSSLLFISTSRSFIDSCISFVLACMQIADSCNLHKSE